MRTPIIAGNWKMNTTVNEAHALVEQMVGRLERVRGVDRVLCPPFVSLTTVAGLLKGSSIGLGAQNMYFEDKGAYTGEVSPHMLVGLCQYVILGHSERRGYFGETDDLVNKKVKAALKAGLMPIVCVGERLQENEAGQTVQVVTRQVQAALAGVEPAARLVIAYEPIWAIGTGKAATGIQANATIGVIRAAAAQVLGDKAAAALRVQYGGSVTTSNVAEFLGQPEIDGALVGGASLKADEFVAIVEKTASVKGVK